MYAVQLTFECRLFAEPRDKVTTARQLHVLMFGLALHHYFLRNFIPLCSLAEAAIVT